MKTVKIGVREYEIVYFSKNNVDPNLFKPNVQEFDDKMAGEIDSLQNKIYISLDQCEESQNQTLMHEIVHGIFRQMGGDPGEIVTDALAEHLYALLLQNFFDFSKKQDLTKAELEEMYSKYYGGKHHEQFADN